MKSNQLVSIIMTCFNGEKYLRESISSIINQTYKHWEIIFVDDGSEDNTFTIAENLLNSQNRLIFKLCFLRNYLNL